MGQVDKQFWRKYYCFENLIKQISYKETNQRWKEWTQWMFIICIADRREKLATPWGGIPVWEGFPAPFPREASFKLESNSVLLEVKISYESGCLVVGRWVEKGGLLHYHAPIGALVLPVRLALARMRRRQGYTQRRGVQGHLWPPRRRQILVKL